MEDLIIPEGKQLRYRCNIHTCSSAKTFSLFSIMDHLAMHYSEFGGTKEIFNYYCKLCRVHFFILGACSGCRCQARGPEEHFVQLKPEVKMSDIWRETSFFTFVHRWAVPVLEIIKGRRSRGCSRGPPSNPGMSDQPSISRQESVSATNEQALNPQQTAERRSRSTVRQPPPENRQGNVPLQRPNPPPLPKRRISRSPGRRPETSSHQHKIEEEQGTSRERRSRSTVRRPPVRNRQDGLLTDNPSPPPVSKRQMSRSPGPSSRIQTAERETKTTNGLRSPRGKTWMTLPTPLRYPDGTPRTPHSDSDEEIEPAYYRAAKRSTSQSGSGTPTCAENNIEKNLSCPATAKDEHRASSAWNGSLPKPQLFNNIFFQKGLTVKTTSAQQTVSTASPATSVRNEATSVSPEQVIVAENQRREEVKAQLTPPPPPPPQNHDPVPPSPSTEPTSLESEEQPPQPAREERAPSYTYYKTPMDDPNNQIPPPPPPPPPSSLGIRLSVPSQPVAKPSLPTIFAASHSNSSDDHDTRKQSTQTFRCATKKSRQDGLLEENPPPPRESRRRLSRSPGPAAPLCPSQNIEHGSKTPAHIPHFSSQGGSTPARGANVTCNESAMLGHRFGTAQTPRYSGGSPDYKKSARSPGRTPNEGCQTPFYGSQTPLYGNRSPGPCFSGREQHTPFYGSQTPGYGGRSPGPGASVRGSHTPRYEQGSPENRSRTPRDGNRTPLCGSHSGASQTSHSSTPISSHTRGLNTACTGHTPIRSPSCYPDGTPRSPRYEDNEEEAVPSYMRSPRSNSHSGEGTSQSTPSTKVPEFDPLSLESRAKTPPLPDNAPLQQNAPPFSCNEPPVNGTKFACQPGMPPPFVPPPQNPIFPPFGQHPFVFPIQNPFGMFPPPSGILPMGVPPPVFPNLQFPPPPSTPLPQSFASKPMAEPPVNGYRTSQQPLRPPATAATTCSSTEEQRIPHSTTLSKKTAPPQRLGGSMFLETPPPATKPSDPLPKPKTKRKRRYSYDRSDSD